MGGLAATDELAQLAKIDEGHRVMDVGCGVGGPARRLANQFGANVIGIKLSRNFSRLRSRLRIGSNWRIRSRYITLVHFRFHLKTAALTL
ncbi:MAG: class I SAM-dependent methyltransferase [Hyphomicrobiaceae bacterium]